MFGQADVAVGPWWRFGRWRTQAEQPLDREEAKGRADEDDGGDSDDEFGMGGGGMNPMEALFQQIHQGMNNGMNPMEALFQQMERMNNNNSNINMVLV